MRGTGYALTEILGWMILTLGLGFLIGWISRGWQQRQDALRWETVARHEREQMLALAAQVDATNQDQTDEIDLVELMGGEDPQAIDLGGLEGSDDADEESSIIEPAHEVIVPAAGDSLPDLDETPDEDEVEVEVEVEVTGDEEPTRVDDDKPPDSAPGNPVGAADEDSSSSDETAAPATTVSETERETAVESSEEVAAAAEPEAEAEASVEPGSSAPDGEMPEPEATLESDPLTGPADPFDPDEG